MGKFIVTGKTLCILSITVVIVPVRPLRPRLYKIHLPILDKSYYSKFEDTPKERKRLAPSLPPRRERESFLENMNKFTILCKETL